jgi:Ca-activated chloride channel family protein
MTGFPLTVTKQLMRDLLTRLRPSDRFNLLLFAGDSRMYAPASVPANSKEIDAAIAYFDAQQSGGGTELLPAMQRALALPPATPNGARSFVVITDGYISEEPELFEHIRQHLGSASVFSFGIGTSVNRHLIDGVAKAGQGEPFVVLNADEAQPVAGKFREYIETPVLTQVQAQYKDFEVYDVAPVSLPDVYAQRPVLVFGKWRGAPRGSVSLTGVSGRGRFVNTFDVARFAPSAGNAALRYLWARTRIRELSDFSAQDAHREDIIKFGLQYNLLTRFTSFIAVHQVVRSDGKATDVAQPQPLPQGVSDEAIGMEVGAEPPLYLALLLVLGVVAWRGRRAIAARGAW